MKRKKTNKKKKIDTERIIFTTVLVAIGIFVICLFSFTMMRFQSTTNIDSVFNTQVVSGDTSIQQQQVSNPLDDPAQTLIIVGAVAFCLLGGVIFLGLKFQEKYY